MPLVATDAQTQERIDITQYARPRLELREREVVCPLCGVKMNVVAGYKRISHFRHRVKCSSSYERHPESNEHLMAKAALTKKLRERCLEFADVEVAIEVPIPEVKRQADILIT